MTAFVPQQGFMIGVDASGSGAMVNLEVDGRSDVYSAPHWTFTPYSKPTVRGDGVVLGLGWATATWDWGIASQVQRDWLRTYCPGMSSVVLIRTQVMDNAEEFRIFHAVMIWPVDAEEHDVRRRPKFTIKFQRLIAL
jgi:hypothetical protein